MTAYFEHKASTPPLCLPGFDNINRYWDKTNDLFAAKILPGQYYVTRNEESIVTVLGSCISACIRDTKKRIGGMNHFMLPSTESEFKNSKMDDGARYGNYAMELLINEILKNGGKREDLQVKIFGGGKIISNMTDVGKRNIEFALSYINTENLSLVAEDTGDIFPRKVYYFPMTGKVKVKRLRSLHNNTILDRETTYMKDLATLPTTGDVDLF